MKVRIWTSGRSRPQKCIWKGTLDQIPREGEWVSVKSGWSPNQIAHVDWNLEEGKHSVDITLFLDDAQNEYPEVKG